jgi:hypothetical protein
MDSNPPAIMTSLTPSWMFWVANMMAFRPDAQTLLIVVASEESGILSSALPHLVNLPRGDTDLPGWTLANTGRNDISEVNLLNFVGRKPGLFDSVLDSSDTELRSGQAREGSSERSDRSSGGRKDIDWVLFE